MKKIAIITTGGTIAMKKGENGLAIPAITAEDFLNALPELNDIAEIETCSWKNLPSSHLEPADVIELSSLLKDYRVKGFAGAVIAHGTDTMEETAYLLELLTDLDMGITITGAQRNPSLPGADGPANLLDAVIIAASAKASHEGVLLVFNGEAHAARDVTKTHASRLDTFKSPEFGPLATVTNMHAHWHRRRIIKEHYNVVDLFKKVEIVKCYLGNDGTLIRLLKGSEIDGLVIEALGAGHVALNTVPAIKEAINIGLPVVLSSRCVGRLFTNTYGFAGAEKDLKDIGVIFGDALSAVKARLKLMVLLSLGLPLEEIRTSFHKNFYCDV